MDFPLELSLELLMAADYLDGMLLCISLHRQAVHIADAA